MTSSTLRRKTRHALELELGLPTQVLKPPLKWAGGKRWQVPHLRSIWSPHAHRRLVEPFCGGLAVAISLEPEHALLNDVNTHLINFYTWLKRGLKIDFDMANEESAYYRCRERFNSLVIGGATTTAEAAGLFYYLNRTGYNGLCRFNQKGLFNVPFGRYKAIHYKNDFAEYRPLLAKWDFLSVDFAGVPFEDEDFVYADPPYDVEFTQYSEDGFTWEEQEQTAEILASHPGPVVLSNQATPRIVKLYRSLKFSLTFLDAPRRISCTGDRTPAPEVLATRNV